MTKHGGFLYSVFSPISSSVVFSLITCGGALAAGVVDGHFRIPEVLGHPEHGYVELYEYNAFLCPEGSGSGWSVRTGALPGQPITGDGWFRFENVPAGNYSLIVTNQVFWPRAGIVPNVVVSDGQTTQLYPEPAADYVVYYSNLGEWGSEPWRWGRIFEQTFVARGTQIIRVSFRIAGEELPSDRIEVTIRNSSGGQVGPSRETGAGALTDLIASWEYGEVPTTPGQTYSVRLREVEGGNGTFALIRRIDSGDGYANGRLRVDDVDYSNEDGAIYVGADNDGLITTYVNLGRATGHRCLFNAGEGDPVDWSTDWAQTWVARGTSLAAAELSFAAFEGDIITFTVHAGGPDGPQIGPAKAVPKRSLASAVYFAGIAYRVGEIALVPGQTYCIRAHRDQGMNCEHICNSVKGSDPYPSGAGYVFTGGTWQPAIAGGDHVDLDFAIYEFEAMGGTPTPTVPVPTPTAPPQGSNLLINPGAETGDFTGWTKHGDIPDQPLIDPTTHIPDPNNHSGSHRFGMSVGWNTVDAYQHQQVNVIPGREYEAGLWVVKRDGTDETLEVLWVDGSFGGLEQSLYFLDGSTELPEWTSFSGERFVPSGSLVTLVLRYRHDPASNIASIHVDDVYLVEIPLEEPTSTDTPTSEPTSTRTPTQPIGSWSGPYFLVRGSDGWLPTGTPPPPTSTQPTPTPLNTSIPTPTETETPIPPATATDTPPGAPTSTPEPPPTAPTVRNGDMEGGFTGNVANWWSSWKTSYYTAGSFSVGTDHYTSPSHSQKFVMPQPAYENSIMEIYQVINTSTGGYYTITLQLRTEMPGEEYGGQHLNVLLGLDPTGGTDIGSLDIHWFQAFDQRDVWRTESHAVWAAGPWMTIHILAVRKWRAGGDGAVWIDDVTVSGPPPEPTPTFTVTVTPTATEPPPVGPELIGNGDFEAGFPGGVADGWSSWSTVGSGYWKSSTLVGPVGGGNYANVLGWYDEAVDMNAKVYLLGVGYGAADGFATEPNLSDSIILGREFIDPYLDQIYHGDYQAVAEWLANKYEAEAGYHPRVDAWLGLNEPDWQENNNWQRALAFETYLTQLMHQRGLKTVVLNLSVGSPGDISRILDCKDLFEIADYFGYHSYGGPNDQLMVNNQIADDPYNYALRARRMQKMYRDRGWRFPPVVYTEGTTYGGWHGAGFPGAEDVRDDMIAFIPYINDDPWCVGLTIFDVGGNGAWEEWDITGYGIAAPVGVANMADPVDKTSGLYSQQWGVGTLHCLNNVCGHDGIFTGGVVQPVTGLSAGEAYRLGFDFKWEFANGMPSVTLEYGLDWSVQTGDPDAASIRWSGDLIAFHGLPHDTWVHHYDVFPAEADSVSLWFRSSQNLADASYRINLDTVSVQQVSSD